MSATISVVVSTYSTDRLGYVLACIDSLKRQTLPPKEIILVFDPDESLINFYKSRVPRDVKIVVSEGYGLSNARNAGVKAAGGEIVAFIDDDAAADKDWLKNLVSNYDDPSTVGVGGLIKPVWESDRPLWFPEELDWIVGCSYRGLPESRSFVRNPIGCNMSFLKDVFGRVGYFKTGIGRTGRKLLDAEEMELSTRVLCLIQDSKIAYDPSAIVYHRVPKARRSLRYLIKRSFYQGYSKALVVKSESNRSSLLSTEKSYLKYLLKIALPSRLKRFFELESLSQSASLLLSMFCVLLGYLSRRTIGHLR